MTDTPNTPLSPEASERDSLIAERERLERRDKELQFRIGDLDRYRIRLEAELAEAKRERDEAYQTGYRRGFADGDDASIALEARLNEAREIEAAAREMFGPGGGRDHMGHELMTCATCKRLGDALLAASITDTEGALLDPGTSDSVRTSLDTEGESDG